MLIVALTILPIGAGVTAALAAVLTQRTKPALKSIDRTIARSLPKLYPTPNSCIVHLI